MTEEETPFELTEELSEEIVSKEKELEEEVGCRAGRLELVSKCYPSPGFTNQLDYIYLAFDIERCEQRLEFDERIEIVHLPLTDVPTIVGDRRVHFLFVSNHVVDLLGGASVADLLERLSS